MFIQIGSNKFDVIEMYTGTGSHTIRLGISDSEMFRELLRNNDSFTIQDGDSSQIVSGYNLNYTVEWDNYVDYNFSFETSPVVITKKELDTLNEQITNLELALCEMYESQEV